MSPRRYTMMNFQLAFATVILSFLTFLPHSTMAVDLQCADPTTFRVSSATNGVKLSFCCPQSHPLFNFTNETMSNPIQYNFTDEKGIVLPSLPTCSGCQFDSWRLCQTSLHYRTYDGPYICCPPDSTCQTFNTMGLTKCLKGSGTIDGNAISDVAAIPVADMDLCRYKKVTTINGNGTHVTTTVPSSPCAPEFQCEAYSQIQYRCTKCKDPRYGPPGVCKTFTCPAGNFCWNMTIVNAYGSPPFSIAQQSCTNGTYCPVNSTQPILCPRGLLCPNASMSTPVNCSVGSYCPDSQTMLDCPRGYVCPNNTLSSPIACSIESLEWCPDPGMSSPAACPRYLYCPDSYSFESCPLGWSCITGSPKYICPAGTYSDISTSTCHTCAHSDMVTSSEGTSGKCNTATPLFWFCTIGVPLIAIFGILGITKLWEDHCPITIRRPAWMERKAKEVVTRRQDVARKRVDKGSEEAKQEQASLSKPFERTAQEKQQFETERPHCKSYLIGKMVEDFSFAIKVRCSSAARISSNILNYDGKVRTRLDDFMHFLRPILLRVLDSPQFFDIASPISLQRYYSDDFYVALMNANLSIVKSYRSFYSEARENIEKQDELAEVISSDILKHVQEWRREQKIKAANGDHELHVSIDELSRTPASRRVQCDLEPELLPYQERNPNSSNAEGADVSMYIYPAPTIVNSVNASAIASKTSFSSSASQMEMAAEGIAHEISPAVSAVCVHVENTAAEGQNQTTIPGGPRAM